MLRPLLVFLILLFFQSIDYRSVLKSDYQKAVQFISDHSKLFLKYSSATNTDPEVIISVLFPEAIRYSIINDYIETKSLEIAYVYSGSADFSIGFFQMKPSFVESLEEYIKTHPENLVKYDTLLIPGDNTLPEIRRIRLERLKKLEYQIVYANCLYDIMKIIYPDIFLYDKSYQIKFISTAYNHGFLTGQEEILEYSSKAFFPLSGKNNTPKHVYSEISLYFFYNDLPSIVNKNK